MTRGKLEAQYLDDDTPVQKVCPACGGPTIPAFGAVDIDEHTRKPVLDPTTVMCRECGLMISR